MAWSPFQLRTKAQEALKDVPDLMLVAERVAAQVFHGAHGQRKKGGHEDFWQYREYQTGDRPQDIDWRQSARSDHIYVREKELQTPQSAYFWCNLSKSMDFRSGNKMYSKGNTAQILTLALALLLQRSEEQVGYLGSLHSGRSDAILGKIAQRLFEADEHTLPNGQAPMNSALILCGDFLEPIDDIHQAFRRYAGRHKNVILIQVLDPAEINLPYSGHVVFEGLSNDDYKIDNVTSIRGTYQDKIDNHLRALRVLCERYGWSYHLHGTDHPLHHTLIDVWDDMEAKS